MGLINQKNSTDLTELIRISTAQSEPWTAWVMLALLVLFTTGNTIANNAIGIALAQLFSTKERDIFLQASNNLTAQIILTVFKICTLALAIYYLLETNAFLFTKYIWVVLLTGAYTLIKFVCSLFLGYAFSLRQQYNFALQQYQNLTLCITTIMYLILLLSFFAPFVSLLATKIAVLTLLIIFVIMWIFKALQLFLSRPFVSLYIFLYLCTLEALPLLSLCFVVKYAVC